MVDRILLPKEAIAWDQVLEPPLRFAPWPYMDAELECIRDALPANGAAIALTHTIFAARLFLVAGQLRRNQAAPAKPDPRGELERIILAMTDLRAAIRSASPQAVHHLSSHPSPGVGRPPVRLRDLSYALHRFEHDNRYALRVLPQRETIGAPKKLSEEASVYRLWIVWRSAHEPRPPTGGWPAFRDASLDPLRDVRFPKELHPASRTQRAWQLLLARARARTRKRKKLAQIT